MSNFENLLSIYSLENPLKSLDKNGTHYFRLKSYLKKHYDSELRIIKSIPTSNFRYCVELHITNHNEFKKAPILSRFIEEGDDLIEVIESSSSRLLKNILYSVA